MAENYFIEIMYKLSDIVIENESDDDNFIECAIGPARICVGDRFREAVEMFDCLVKWNLNRVDYIRLRIGDRVLTRLTASGVGDW